MRSTKKTGWLAEQFLSAYEKSLHGDYRLFYDDIDTYGNRESDVAFYFIEGINGSPGQIRFALPSLTRVFGRDFFLKCCYLDPLSAKNFVWEKCTLENLDKKKLTILSDLKQLGRQFKKINIIVSNNGFYNFLHAYNELEDSILNKSQLIWVAASPDQFSPSPWASYFRRLNGCIIDKHEWFAFPNHNWLEFLNPEASLTHTFSTENTHKKIFHKADIEVRFKCIGLLWAYASISCFNEMLNYLTRDFHQKIELPTYVLAATRDGYWGKNPKPHIRETLDKYIDKEQVIYKESSHLWLLTPDNLTELLSLIH